MVIYRAMFPYNDDENAWISNTYPRSFTFSE